ncbi:cell division protein FtsQ/DivIB [Jannaschia aquimarina]|uniref:Cell division protein FtsQ n=1 Tax=Jannaschia aquimarina TaxID=935700 RepID=A0A0D1CM65_9RHOB|nr:cell division protein FtsQ/DivIB [Jannaschia aquimarina]KIT15832.1 Cell division protein FtsQ [Jannaschia aquimarina]SNT09619.1 cell division protein FtsQ [Jannaschia aquimarina]
MANVKPDPAPSKWRYRLERLWLTPLFRALVRTGIPSFTLVFLFAWYINDPHRIEAIRTGWQNAVDAVQDRPEFMVGLLRIEGAGQQLQADIQEALPLELPISRFKLDLAELRAELEKLDPVRSVELRIKSGGVLLLRVTERTPAVVWRGEDGIDVLDAEGHRVATLDSLDAAGALPLISGEGAAEVVPEALTLLRSADPIRDRLVGLVRIGDRRWDVILTGGTRILLPEVAPAAALDRALAMHEARDVLSRDIAALDLRLPRRATLRLNPGAVAELKRMQQVQRLSYEEAEDG